jgi:hypothetical protein
MFSVWNLVTGKCFLVKMMHIIFSPCPWPVIMYMCIFAFSMNVYSLTMCSTKRWLGLHGNSVMSHCTLSYIMFKHQVGRSFGGSLAVWVWTLYSLSLLFSDGLLLKNKTSRDLYLPVWTSVVFVYGISPNVVSCISETPFKQILHWGYSYL